MKEWIEELQISNNRKDGKVLMWKEKCESAESANRDLESKYRAAKAEIAEMQNQIAKYREEEMLAKKRKTRMKAKDDELLLELEKERSERQKLDEECDNLDEQLKKSNQLYKELQEEHVRMKEEHQSASNMIEDLQSSVNYLNVNCDNLNKEKDELEEENNNLKYKKDELLEANKGLQDQIQEILNKLEAKDEEILKLKSTSSSSSHKRSKGKPPKARPSIDGRRGSETGVTPRMSIDQLTEGSNGEELSEVVQQTLRDQEEQIQRLEQDLQAERDENERLKYNRRSSAVSNDSYISVNDEPKINYEALQYQDKYKEAVKHNKGLQSQLFHLEEDSARIAQENQDLRVWKANAEAKIPGIETVKKDVLYLKEQVQHRNEVIEKYKRIINKYLNQVRSMKHFIEVNVPKVKVKKYMSSIDDLDDDLLGAISHEVRVKHRVGHAVGSAKANRRKSEAESEDAAYARGRMEEALEKMQDELDILARENEDLKIELNEKIDMLEHMDSQQTDADRSAHEKELEKLKRLYDRAQDRIRELETNLQNKSFASDAYKSVDHTNELNELRSSNIQFSNRIQELEARESMLQNRLNEANAELHENQRKLSDSLRKSSTIQEKKVIVQDNSQLEANEIRLRDRENQIRNLNEVNRALNAEIALLKAKLGPMNKNDDYSDTLRRDILNLQRDLEAVQLENEKKQTKLMNANAMVDQFREEIARLKKKLHALQDKLDNRPENIKHLPSSNEKAADMALREARRKISSLEHLKDIHTSEIEDLRAKLDGARMRADELDKMRARMDFHEKDIDTDRNRIKEQTVITMKQAIAGYNIMLNQKDQAIKDYEDRIAALRDEFIRAKREAEAEILDLKNLLQDQDGKLLYELRAHIAEIEKRSDVIAKPVPHGMPIDEVDEIIHEKDCTIEEMMARNGTLETQLDKLNLAHHSQLQNFNNLKAHLESEIQSLKALNERLRLELNAERAKKVTPAKAKPSPIKQQKTKIIVKRPDEKLRKEFESTKADLTSERTRNTQLEESIQILTQSLVDAEQALAIKEKHSEAEIEAKIRRLSEKRTKNLEKTVRKLKDRLATYEGKKEQKERIYDALDEKLVQLQRELDSKQKVIDRQLKSIGQLQKTKSKLESKLNSYRENDTVAERKTQRRLEELEKRNRVLEAKSSQFNVKKQIEEFSMRERDIKERLAKQREDNNRLMEEHRKMEADNNITLTKVNSEVADLALRLATAEEENNELRAINERMDRRFESLESAHEEELKKRQAQADQKLRTAVDRAEKKLRSEFEKEKKPKKTTHQYERKVQLLENALERQKKQHAEEVASIEKKNVALKHDHEEARSKLEDIGDKINQLPEIVHLTNQVANLEEALETVKRESEIKVSQMKAEVKTKSRYAKMDQDDARAKMRQELIEKEQELIDHIAQKAGLETKVKALERQIANLTMMVEMAKLGTTDATLLMEDDGKSSKRSKSKKMKELENTITSMRRVVTKLQEENRSIRVNSVSNVKYMDLMGKLKKYKAKASELSDQVKSHDDVVASKVEKSNKLKKALDKISKLHKELKDIQSQHASLKKKEQKTRLENDQLQDDLDALRKKHQSMVQAGNKRTDMRIKEEKDDLTATIKALKKEHKQEMDALTTKLDEVNDAKDDLEAQLEATANEKASLEKDLKATKEKLYLAKHAARESHDDEEEEEVEEKEDNQKAQNDYLRRQILDMRDENMNLKEEIERQKSKKSSHAQEVSELKDNMKVVQSENDELQEEVKKLKDHLSSFDENFFDNIEDLKYSYMVYKKLSLVYQEQLKDLNQDYITAEELQEKLDQEKEEEEEHLQNSMYTRLRPKKNQQNHFV
eukprot:CAMPEP_0117420986 /NCGR_PEP_ID=MMETSP0758-20121206/2197_1 /TAXON_ID=63605 /ORGANISM="Percolomonas cosmopolitus, Strain AE-1 (ATCC 50343)" /LENGTH=1841 /DNA_ID=CAMNT_0005202897 /DNA_START=230 /DNA_END=5756 /DNA_ORIENTATION=-